MWHRERIYNVPGYCWGIIICMMKKWRVREDRKEKAIVQFDCDMFIQIVIKSYGEIFLPASFNSRRGIIQSEIIKSRAQFKAFSFPERM